LVQCVFVHAARGACRGVRGCGRGRAGGDRRPAQDPRRRPGLGHAAAGAQGVRISEVSIHRPAVATAMSLVVVLVGLVGYSRLSVREYPNIDPPVVTVTTTYTGASAAIVETQVTKVLEDSLSGIEGIDYITSISRQEQSQITIRFKLE